jgi:aspartate 1-decarboxylase
MIPLLQDDPMLREMFQAKIHHATVTDCRLGYQGSLTVDIDLIERAGMLVNQKIQVLNISNGYRLETYLIPGERGKREIVVNGAAARHAQVGDQLIVIAYALMNEDEVRTHQPVVVILDRNNQPIPSAP